jgi:protocatechuate 3,4-dioxygenase beta subunit
MWAGLVALLVGVVWWGVRAGGAPGQTDAGGQEAAEAESGGEEGEAPIARVSGRVWIEVQPEPEPAPEPVAVVVVEDGRARVLGDTDGTDGTGTTGDTGDTGDTADTYEADVVADDEASAPPDYELAPPPAGDCQVLAWQSGTRVGGPVVCADDGTFELPLDPGLAGPTAFEILVPGRLRAVVQVDVPYGGRGRLPEVALGVAETVVGQVVDREGAPVVGASIEAMPLEHLDEPEPWRVSSDAEGNFVLDTLPPGPVGLRASAPGFAVTVAEAIAPQDDVLLVLDRLYELRGRVAGPPDVLARTRVRLEGSGVWPARQVALKPDGTFTFDRVPDGVYAVEAVAPPSADGPGYASIPLENVTPELAVTLGLVAAFDVEVLVEDPMGHPAAGARVTLGNASIGVLQRFATTGEDGIARVGPVVPGPYVLRADAEGYLPATPLSIAIEDADPPQVTLRLAAPGEIRGQVVDEDGRPVEGARVSVVAQELHTVGESAARARVFSAAAVGTGSLGVTEGPVPPIPGADEDDDEGIASPRSDADGRFAVELLPPGRYALVATHPDFAHGTSVDVELGVGAHEADVVLTLRAGERLTGRVVDGNGRPVDGARVRVDDDSVFTDRRGVFDAGPRRGRVRIVARAAGLAPAVEVVTVGARPVDVELVLAAADGELSGRIEGENGEVLADARVTLRMLDDLSETQVQWTDARGLYAFTGLPTGRAEIVVDHPEHGAVERKVEVSRGRDPVDVALPRGWSLDVEVLAAGTGVALPGIRVTAGDHRATTDAQGRATLSHLVEESVTVAAEAEDYGRASARVTRPSGPSTDVRLTLSEGGGLAGRVTDYRGDPVGGASVVVIDGDGDEVARTTTGADGRFTVDGVTPGDVEIEASPPAGRRDELAPAALATDVMRGHVTRGVDLRFDRQ